MGIVNMLGIASPPWESYDDFYKRTQLMFNDPRRMLYNAPSCVTLPKESGNNLVSIKNAPEINEKLLLLIED